MVVSPFLLSLGMWFLVFAAWWYTATQLPSGQIDETGQPIKGASLREARTWWRVLDFSFRRLFRQKSFSAFLLILLAPTLSFFWSDDKAYWLRLVQTALPFLVLPWVLANLPDISDRQWKSTLYLLIWFMTAVCIGVGINFVMHFDAMIEGLGRGNPIPVPRSHVRFSLILATTIIAGGWLWQQGFFLWRRWERKILGIAVLFLFFFIHVLSVRGGLFSLYAGLFFLSVRYIWISRRWLVGLGVLFGLTAALVIAATSVPSLNRRIGYMLYDWGRFRTQNEGYLYSDASRWISMRVGWQLWEESPVLGTGAGDLMEETRKMTARLFPEYAQEARLPHNQFLFVMASTGLPGLAAFLTALILPFYRNRRKALFTTFQVMAWASFLIECTIENAIGVAWFLFFSLWFMVYPVE